MPQLNTNSVADVPFAISGRTNAPAAALKIVQVVTRLSVGGTEHAMLNVISGLDDGSADQQICVLRGVDPNLPWKNRIHNEILIAGKEGLGFRLDVWHLFKLFRKVKPQIVHSRNWGTLEAVIAARLAGVPVVIHSEHGYELDMLQGLPLRRRLFRALAFRSAHKVCAVTEDLCRYHAAQAFYPVEKMSALYNGVDVTRFCPDRELRLRVRNELGLKDSTCLVGTVGRMVAIKDQQSLLEAVAALSSQGLDVAALLVGSGPEEAKLRERGAQLLGPRAIFAGASARVADYLNAMDVFVLPSISEGMSNTLLEAMATGLPLVATSVGGNPEVLSDTGMHFPPRDVTRLAEILSSLATNVALREDMGAKSRERALSKFSLDSMIQRYRDLYWGMASEKGLLPQMKEVSYVRN